MTAHPDPDVEASVAFVRDEWMASDGDGRTPSAILRSLLETPFGARAWARSGELGHVYIVWRGFDVHLTNARSVEGWDPTSPGAPFSDERLDELLTRAP